MQEVLELCATEVDAIASMEYCLCLCRKEGFNLIPIAQVHFTMRTRTQDFQKTSRARASVLQNKLDVFRSEIGFLSA